MVVAAILLAASAVLTDAEKLDILWREREARVQETETMRRNRRTLTVNDAKGAFQASAEVDPGMTITSFRVSRNGLYIAWSRPSGVLLFRVSRRVAGTESWSVVSSAQAETSFSIDGDTTADNWEYRIEGVRE